MDQDFGWWRSFTPEMRYQSGKHSSPHESLPAGLWGSRDRVLPVIRCSFLEHLMFIYPNLKTVFLLFHTETCCSHSLAIHCVFSPLPYNVISLHFRNKSEPLSNTKSGVEQSKGLGWWLRVATSDCLMDMHGWAGGLNEFKSRKPPNNSPFLLLWHVPYEKYTIPKIWRITLDTKVKSKRHLPWPL